jgi:DNA primase
VKSIRYENSRSAMAEEGIIRLLYLDSQLFDRITPPDPSHFSVPELGHIYQEMLELGRYDQVEIPKLAGRLSGDELSLLTTIIQKPETVANGLKALSDYIDIMEGERRSRQGNMSLTELAESMRNKKAYTPK